MDSRTPLTLVLMRVALLVFVGCGPSHACAARQRAPNTSEVSQQQAFQPPDSTGWGRVAGLRYLELLRGNARPEQKLPMLIVIHGLGDRPRPDWLEVIDVDVPARIILPEAPTPFGEGYSWFPFRVGENDPQTLTWGISQACEQLAQALKALQVRRPTIGRPIVTGFSQGGMLSFALALRHPDLVQEALPISGTLPEPMWPVTRASASYMPPIRALHGTTDTIVPFEPTQRLVARLRRLGYDATLQAFPGVPHAIAHSMLPVIRATLTAAAQALDSR